MHLKKQLMREIYEYMSIGYDEPWCNSSSIPGEDISIVSSDGPTCLALIHSASSWLRLPTAPPVCPWGENTGSRTWPTLLYGMGTPSSRARVGTRSVCGTTSGSLCKGERITAQGVRVIQLQQLVEKSLVMAEVLYSVTSTFWNKSLLLQHFANNVMLFKL